MRHDWAGEPLEYRFWMEFLVKVSDMCWNFVLHELQVKESLLQQFLEYEQTAKDQATDNAILDQLRKVS